MTRYTCRQTTVLVINKFERRFKFNFKEGKAAYGRKKFRPFFML